MQHLFAPWRFEYVSQASSMTACIFCDAVAELPGSLTVIREGSVFALLNRYPYTSGHTMVAPVEHVAELDELDDQTLTALMRLTHRVTAALRAAYNPDAFNLGMNIGATAGAGIPEHLHLHIVPRWVGDTNFMTVTGNVRVIPEDLAATLRKLRDALGSEDA